MYASSILIERSKDLFDVWDLDLDDSIRYTPQKNKFIWFQSQ